MEQIANVDQWVENVTKVNDGDNRDAENHNIGQEDLADRTFHLYTHSLLDSAAKPAGNSGVYDFLNTVYFRSIVSFEALATVLVKAGASTTFQNTPTFQTGYVVSGGNVAMTTGTTSITATTSASITAPTITLAGNTTLSGAGRKLKLTPRLVERKISLSRAMPEIRIFDPVTGTQSPTYSRSGDGLQIFVGAIVQTLTVDLDPPHNSVLKAVIFDWVGTGNVTMDVLENGVSIATPVTTSTPGSYTLALNTTTDCEAKIYRAQLTANSGDPIWIALKRRCEVNEYDEG